VSAEDDTPLATRVVAGVPPLRFALGLRGRYSARRRERRLRTRDEALLAAVAGRDDGRLNVGSSSSHLPGWINADLLRDPEGACIVMDATKRWPLPDACLEAVNSEQFVEHLSREAARAYFREAFRALRLGGVIRTTTPDLAALCRSLLEHAAHDLAAHREHGYEAATHGEMFNNYAYSWGHRQLYDEETLARMLSEAGFVGVVRRSFGESAFEILRGIDRHDLPGLRKLLLCVDAERPAD